MLYSLYDAFSLVSTRKYTGTYIRTPKRLIAVVDLQANSNSYFENNNVISHRFSDYEIRAPNPNAYAFIFSIFPLHTRSLNQRSMPILITPTVSIVIEYFLNIIPMP